MTKRKPDEYVLLKALDEIGIRYTSRADKRKGSRTVTIREPLVFIDTKFTKEERK